VAIPTKIDFDDFFESVKQLAIKHGFRCRPYNGKRASAICFEFFKGDNQIPAHVFCVDEDKHAKVIYTDDLKKACKVFGITKKDFEKFVRDELV